ncbi:MAG: penicillin-insensitive murein endopeptidase [Gammaproteobacteria bacterium]|nr:penicillin-insensitive murein endopeptidase [Gammaproteobacteria bacterium]MCP5425761.1 penicillin-insensitive murein endopeptidase [Gammaproteobacteria bacterium]MCP5458628.1 penicillin-insensitive murein endopeptidase [Gammaproteobacteria bacterium]
MKYLLVMLASLAFLNVAQADSLWGQVSHPVGGPAQAIGFYSAGCLAGGRALPLQGQGYQVMRPSRNRYYGHPVLITFIESLGRQAAGRGERLLIGDMSQPRGGPMDYGHASHQIGLDVDVWFEQAAPGQTLTRQETEGKAMISTVLASQGRINPQRWSPRYRDILMLAASDPRVERIFVNPIIKQTLCQSDRGNTTWMPKIRPWWGHDAHFHVRLRCPAGSPQCRPQDPPSQGDGCDASLTDWVGQVRRAALRPAIPGTRPQRKAKILPAACQEVLRGNWAAQPTTSVGPAN